MKPKVYIETSIISYLTARPSRDVVVNANQILAREWWEDHRHNFDLFVSKLVFDEASRGDEVIAQKRLALIQDIPFLDVNEDVILLAEAITQAKILPAKAAADVSHIAVSSVHEVDFLLTLNCRHIANAFIFRRVGKICREFNYEPPIVCTPQEILGKENKIDER